MPVSELQRLPFGDALVLHGRMYPYVTHLPDISEYGFTEHGELQEEEHVVPADPELVDMGALVYLINEGEFPEPFGDEVPAIDLYEGDRTSGTVL